MTHDFKPELAELKAYDKAAQACSLYELGALNHAAALEAAANPVDVEGFKKDYCSCRDCKIWNACIDHLAAQGYLAAPLPHIEGLEDALEDHRCAGDAILGKNIDILAKAATEYAKRMEKP